MLKNTNISSRLLNSRDSSPTLLVCVKRYVVRYGGTVVYYIRVDVLTHEGKLRA